MLGRKREKSSLQRGASAVVEAGAGVGKGARSEG